MPREAYTSRGILKYVLRIPTSTASDFFIRLATKIVQRPCDTFTHGIFQFIMMIIYSNLHCLRRLMIADVSTAADVESLAVRHARGRRYMADLLTVILGNRFAVAVNSFVGNNMELPVIRLRCVPTFFAGTFSLIWPYTDHGISCLHLLSLSAKHTQFRI